MGAGFVLAHSAGYSGGCRAQERSHKAFPYVASQPPIHQIHFEKAIDTCVLICQNGVESIPSG